MRWTPSVSPIYAGTGRWMSASDSHHGHRDSPFNWYFRHVTLISTWKPKPHPAEQAAWLIPALASNSDVRLFAFDSCSET